MEVKIVCLAMKIFNDRPFTVKAFDSFNAAVMFVEREVDRYNEISLPGEKYSVVQRNRALLNSSSDQLLLSEHERNGSKWFVQRVHWNSMNSMIPSEPMNYASPEMK